MVYEGPDLAERINAEPRPDLISMLAHGESTRNMDRMEYLGNLILLIVGGNDTTRNSMTGGLMAVSVHAAGYLGLRPDQTPTAQQARPPGDTDS